MALGDTLAAKLAPIIGGTVLAGDVTVRVVTGGTYNTTTGEVNESVSDTAIRGVVSDVNVREANELIQAGDKKLTIAAADVTAAPKTKDRVVISSVVYQVIQVQTEQLNGVDISYDLFLRA